MVASSYRDPVRRGRSSQLPIPHPTANSHPESVIVIQEPASWSPSHYQKLSCFTSASTSYSVTATFRSIFLQKYSITTTLVRTKLIIRVWDSPGAHHHTSSMSRRLSVTITRRPGGQGEVARLCPRSTAAVIRARSSSSTWSTRTTPATTTWPAPATSGWSPATRASARSGSTLW